MSTIENMPAISPELDTLLAAEKPIPPAPAGLRDRVLERLSGTLGWDEPPPGGGSAAGGLAGAGRILMAVLLTTGLGGLGYYALGGEGGGHRAGKSQPTAVHGDAFHGTPGRLPARASQEVPAWFGEAARSPRVIAGRVTFRGRPVPGARVVLESDMTRVAVQPPMETVANDEGWFRFGEQPAAWYDVSATVPGSGYGHLRVATHDPTARPGALVVRLSGCEHVLHGEVRDVSGGVIVGAEVLPSREQWPLAVGVATDSRGHYELCTHAGAVDVTVSAQGYGAIQLRDHVVGRRKFDVELVPEGVVAGRVVQAQGGSPVPGMAIWLYPAAWPDRIRTTSAVAISDADGRFHIPGLSPGRHILYGESRRESARPVPVLIGAGEESDEVTLRASPHASIRGVVIASGKPVPGARIAPVVDGRKRDVAIADQRGEFSLWPLSAGVIQFEVEGYAVTAPIEYEVKDAADAPITVDVVELGAIGGQVVRGGTPVADAEVMASSRARKDPAFCRSGEDGTFALRGLPAGSYVVSANSDAARAFSTTSASPTIELRSREIRSDVVLELDGGASIAGTVVDSSDHALAGVVVEYLDAQKGDSCQAITDEQGTFSCGPLAGGATYVPTVRPDVASSMRFPAASGSSLAGQWLADGTGHVAEQVLRIRARREHIRGRVLSQEGSPYPDATVRAIEASTGYTPATAPWHGLRTAISDADGRFQLSVWQGARFTLQARTPSGAEGSVQGVRAGSSDVAIVVAESGDIRGTLIGFDEAPELFVRGVGNTVDIVRSEADADSFFAEGLAPGEYAIIATLGTRGGAKTVTVRSGETTRTTLDAKPSARLELAVMDFVTGTPVQGARCKAAPFIRDAGVFGIGTPLAKPTNSSGRTSLDAPTGSIEISCLSRELHHSEGAARMTATQGNDNQLVVYVVVSKVPHDRSNGIGAQILMGFERDGGGYTHTLVEVRPGGAAEQSGLRVGDRIVQIDGRDVSPLTDFGVARLFGTHSIGASIELTVRRGQVLRTHSVVLESPAR